MAEHSPEATRLEQIKARLAAATPGPWEANDGMIVTTVQPSRSQWPQDTETVDICGGNFGGEGGGYYVEDEDADLIANAPTDIAYLVAENARLQGVIEAARHIRADTSIRDGYEQARDLVNRIRCSLTTSPQPTTENGVCVECGGAVLSSGEHVEPERHTPGWAARHNHPTETDARIGEGA